MKENELDMLINNATYDDYFARLKMLAMSLFSWENLDKIAGFGAEKFLEKTLFEDGKACFIKDPEMRFFNFTSKYI